MFTAMVPSLTAQKNAFSPSLLSLLVSFQMFREDEMSHPNCTNFSLLKPPLAVFPNVGKNVTTTFCSQNEDRLTWIGLQEQVLSWLHVIHGGSPELCPALSSTYLLDVFLIRRVSKDRKRHQYSPYPMRCEPPHPLTASSLSHDST